MIANKKRFSAGLFMMIGFAVILILFFMPIFGGKDGLDYLDNLYNSISKGSAYYIPKVKEQSAAFNGSMVTVALKMAGKTQADQTAKLFKAGGAKVAVSDGQLKVEGDLGKILDNCLADSDAMYKNDGKKVAGKYGYEEKRVLYNWWQAFQEMDKELKKQKKFKEATGVNLVVQKAVECSYNFYQIEAQKIGDKVGIVFFSLLFYVIYTLWYGFSIMYMFEGWGLKLEH